MSSWWWLASWWWGGGVDPDNYLHELSNQIWPILAVPFSRYPNFWPTTIGWGVILHKPKCWSRLKICHDLVLISLDQFFGPNVVGFCNWGIKGSELKLSCFRFFQGVSIVRCQVCKEDMMCPLHLFVGEVWFFLPLGFIMKSSLEEYAVSCSNHLCVANLRWFLGSPPTRVHQRVSQITYSLRG